MPRKQPSHNLPSLIFIFILFFSACAPQAAVHPTVPGSSVISSFVETATATPAPVEISSKPIKIKNAAPNQRVYALVAPFPTVTDGITSQELDLAWTEGIEPAELDGHPLLMAESTLEALKTLWGEPAGGLVR